MGLAAPKNRFKISKDPNNTTWSNNTSRFGHKLLTAQGWTPGSTLGAKDASHSSHYTAASSSHIRILLKDDNLGLGAKRGSDKAENFGLAGLDSVLARLNGKSDAEVKEVEKKAEEKKLKVFASQKWGFMNFVSGGYLVGDKIERKKPIEESTVKAVVAVKEEKPKKRKRSRDVDEEQADDAVEEQPKLKRKKKSIDLKAESRAQAAKDSSAATSETESKSKKDKKEKKEKKDKKKKKADTEDEAPSEPLTEKEIRRAEKRARKEERRLKKEKRRAEKAKAKASASTSDVDSSSAEEMQTGTSTPSVSTPNSGLTFGVMGGHAAVRQRYIRQKKMASMDPNALKEIFMIKSNA